MDEKQPHTCTQKFTQLGLATKENKYRSLSAATCTNRTILKSFHKDLSGLEREFGFDGRV